MTSRATAARDDHTPTIDWTPEGPRSVRYGDVYFSREDGLAESRAVFLQGCDLPEAWAGRRDFVVGELGFGTGLNIAALLDLWRRERPAGGRLHLFSIEAFPLSREEAGRALGAWPELAPVVRQLVERWPSRARGLHRVDLPELDARLDLFVGEAAEALAAWSGRADAWFLDGFAPSTNPEMWREEVLALVAARSAPGARAATFTVAGAVRRGLAAQGFAVEKRQGFGRKRERLEARLEHVPVRMNRDMLEIPLLERVLAGEPGATEFILGQSDPPGRALAGEAGIAPARARSLWSARASPAPRSSARSAPRASSRCWWRPQAPARPRPAIPPPWSRRGWTRAPPPWPPSRPRPSSGRAPSIARSRTR